MGEPNPFAADTNVFETQQRNQGHTSEVVLDFPESTFTAGDYSEAVPAVPQDVPDDNDFQDRPREALLDDKAQENSSGDAKKTSMFSIARYSKYFDVDTRDVLDRISDSVFIPHPGDGDFLTKCSRQPDLYGPFWICTTLVFVTAASGNFADYLGNKEDEWYYDIGEVTFSSLLFYGYTVIFPIILYFVLRFYVKGPLNFSALLCLYGYSLFVFIPISMLCIIPSETARWIIVATGAFESAIFLVLNLRSRLKDQDQAKVLPVLLSVAICHVGLALTLKLHFFKYY
ncbi:hypothetical protein CYMTET_13601 [Cymbomonas tetramitiformis]|uniref:Protein YIP n=1 Tax=Cymbomonas tetramitiformis TaxID=36881 RepID=A0AAE0LAQ3_9CHLO|nr:hypothetical protein CYMTET_13601 [Cymbomonas tetramitiformis]